MSIDLTVDDLGDLFAKLDSHLALEPRFKLPRTTVISEEEIAQRYDIARISEIVSGREGADYTPDS